MFGFLRNRPGHVEHTAVPHEPSAAERAGGVDSPASEARWREERIDSVDRQIADAVFDGNLEKVDRLLDYRNSLCQARIGVPPVIPGRAS